MNYSSATRSIHFTIVLFVLVAFFPLLLGMKRRTTMESRAVEAIEKLSGSVAYREGDETAKCYFALNQLRADKRADAKLVYVDLSSTDANDETLKSFGGLRDVDYLDLSFTRITDKGLKNVANMKEMDALNLSKTAVTDAGLINLEGMTKIKLLTLPGGVSAEAMRKLKARLPGALIHHHREEYETEP